MKILNVSTEEQCIRITDRYKNTYSIYLPSGKITELEPTQISQDVHEMVKLGIFKVVTSYDSTAEIIEVVKIPTEVPEILVEDKEPKNAEIPSGSGENLTDGSLGKNTADTVKDSMSDIFICDICKAEFGSKKGLSMHMNKSHKEVE